MSEKWDVIIIGGSYAGLSAAMALGRSLRKVLIIDSGKPCNLQTPHSHNFITQDGEPPRQIAKKAKEQVLKYDSVRYSTALVTHAKKVGNHFEIETDNGETFQAKKLILATGIKDILPEIEGFSDCWGISVIHCPYCHGYEFRKQKTAILANGERAFHLTSLVCNLSNEVTILTQGAADFNEEQMSKLKTHDVKVIETMVSKIEHENGYVKHLIFHDGYIVDFTAVYASIPFEQHSDLPIQLGIQLTEQGYIQIDSFQKTSVEGVYACGDNCSPLRAVSQAVAQGTLAGAMVNKELVDQSF